jgi:hypothetical protein
MPSDVHVGQELADPAWDSFVEATRGAIEEAWTLESEEPGAGEND